MRDFVGDLVGDLVGNRVGTRVVTKGGGDLREGNEVGVVVGAAVGAGVEGSSVGPIDGVKIGPDCVQTHTHTHVAADKYTFKKNCLCVFPVQQERDNKAHVCV